MEEGVRVENLVKRHGVRGLTRRLADFTAVDSASFSILPGTTLALVGESGSGKSSVALCLSCLERVTAGQNWFAGGGFGGLREEEVWSGRPQQQLVFYDATRSLATRWSGGEDFGQSLLVLGRGS